MKERKMDCGDLLLSCMEQKIILLTKTSDLTKQMEVRSKQEDIEMGDLAAQRQVFIDRLKKCESVIASCIDGLPEEQRERQKKSSPEIFRKRNVPPPKLSSLAAL